MKTIKIVFSAVFLVIFCTQAMAQPKIQFEKTTHDFGDIKIGPDAKVKFKFQNIGNEPLLITSATASCGCTVPNYPTNPIPAGGTGEIEVVYTTAGREGVFTKTVTISSNSDGQPTLLLTIKGNVVR